jgi:phosphoribosylaminoimidazole-succinocarboxamide synthase
MRNLLLVPCTLQGKVRDTYDMGDKVVIVTTDRQSAFDRLLASVPFKGQVLNQTSAWWMKNTTHIVKNALISTPDPNIAVMKKCTVFPVEFVCRGFMTGASQGPWLSTFPCVVHAPFLSLSLSLTHTHTHTHMRACMRA